MARNLSEMTRLADRTADALRPLDADEASRIVSARGLLQAAAAHIDHAALDLGPASGPLTRLSDAQADLTGALLALGPVRMAGPVAVLRTRLSAMAAAMTRMVDDIAAEGTRTPDSQPAPHRESAGALR